MLRIHSGWKPRFDPGVLYNLHYMEISSRVELFPAAVAVFSVGGRVPPQKVTAHRHTQGFVTTNTAP